MSKATDELDKHKIKYHEKEEYIEIYIEIPTEIKEDTLSIKIPKVQFKIGCVGCDKKAEFLERGGSC